MLQAISEYSVIYFKIGGVFGFGIGALAQIVKGTGCDWRLKDCLILTAFWPMVGWTLYKKTR